MTASWPCAMRLCPLCHKQPRPLNLSESSPTGWLTCDCVHTAELVHNGCALHQAKRAAMGGFLQRIKHSALTYRLADLRLCARCLKPFARVCNQCALHQAKRAAMGGFLQRVKHSALTDWQPHRNLCAILPNLLIVGGTPQQHLWPSWLEN